MDALSFVFISLILLVSINLFGLILSVITIHSPKLDRYRIQVNKINPSVFYRRLPLIGVNILVLCTISSFGLYFLFPVFDPSLNFTFWVFIAQIGFILFVDDLFFYFLHRLMHENKFLLKNIHSLHHKATAPVALEYMYVHPVEWMLGYIGPFIGIGLIALVSPVSCWAFWGYVLLRNLHELDIHSGYRSVLTKWVPFWGEAEHHDDHHARLNGNYASTFTFWDAVFRTKMK